MKFDFLKPHQLKNVIGGDHDTPSCWDNPDDNNDPLFPGGPTITVPGFPPYGSDPYNG